MNDMSKDKNIDIQIYNFAYLDENTKRMIRRALLKALCIPGYQVPFSSREMPMPYGWGTGGIQVTSACLIPKDIFFSSLSTVKTLASKVSPILNKSVGCLMWRVHDISET